MMTTLSTSQVAVTDIALSASFGYAGVEPLTHDRGDTPQTILLAQQTSPDKPGTFSKDMDDKIAGRIKQVIQEAKQYRIQRSALAKEETMTTSRGCEA